MTAGSAAGAVQAATSRAEHDRWRSALPIFLASGTR
jgi:hypothetical protein